MLILMNKNLFINLKYLNKIYFFKFYLLFLIYYIIFFIFKILFFYNLIFVLLIF